MRHWDIFCKIVDNYGDIGVCWRLAKQLAHEHGILIRLYVDDLVTAQRFIPSLNLQLSEQKIDEIVICQWPAKQVSMALSEVVIEAFGCGLPLAWQNAMTDSTVWVNLEYLSAESWVENYHGKWSAFGAGKPKRYFFYPGFTEKTGGLIRESNAISLASPKTVEDCLNISLFCYPNAPIQPLLTALQANNHEVIVHVPAAGILPQVAQFLGKKSVEIGETLVQKNLTVKVLPFLSQADYDALLRSCDLNFVRGEDSWVRAIWASKPFIWQPYPQENEAHILKLHAFLKRFYAAFAQKEMLWEAHEYWVAGQGNKSNLDAILQHLPQAQAHTARESAKLAALTDLASNLVIFIENLR